MIINNKEILDIIIRDKNGDDILYIGEEEVINKTSMEIVVRFKNDINHSQIITDGKHSKWSIRHV